jgi:hypothetical protein
VSYFNVSAVRYNIRMSRYRLRPTQTQEVVLLRHCADARYVWNLCVEQESWWRVGRASMPGFAERCRQLSSARAANPWLAEGSVIVQQQAIRDHCQAMTNFFTGTHRRLLVRRLEHKAPGRVEKIHPAFTSQRCSACGHIAADSRESQALYRCVACGFACNADVNAAINIAAGHAVTARGRSGLPERVNREPQLVLLQYRNGLEFSA